VRGVIVYESMFGNTHAIADAIGKGLEPMLEVVVVPLAEAGRERLGDADLLVVGGPTHFHGIALAGRMREHDPRAARRRPGWLDQDDQDGAAPHCQLLSPLAQELLEYRLAAARPPDQALIVSGTAGRPWTKGDWQNWRNRQWAGACRAVGLDPVPRPYDLRHSFTSVLLAGGRQPMFVGAQGGHSLAVMLSTYAHLIDEYAERTRVDPVSEITKAREHSARLRRAQ
jgi:Phage integrase family